MTELWPSKSKAKENPLDDLMGKIEEMFTDGQIKELQLLIRDLGDLAMAVRDLVKEIESKKAFGVKAQDVSGAMAEIRKRIGSERPPEGVVAGMAAWIARH